MSAEHGFVSMLPVGNGNTLMSWLDGRNTKAAAGCGEMTLRAGIFGARGETLSEWELDARVCDCCQTSAAMSAAGPIIVYRDRSAGEIRDIYITRYANGDWTPPVAIHDDQWEIAGCPVNGPSVAAQGTLWPSAGLRLRMIRLRYNSPCPLTVANIFITHTGIRSRHHRPHRHSSPCQRAGCSELAGHFS